MPPPNVQSPTALIVMITGSGLAGATTEAESAGEIVIAAAEGAEDAEGAVVASGGFSWQPSNKRLAQKSFRNDGGESVELDDARRHIHARSTIDLDWTAIDGHGATGNRNGSAANADRAACHERRGACEHQHTVAGNGRKWRRSRNGTAARNRYRAASFEHLVWRRECLRTSGAERLRASDGDVLHAAHRNILRASDADRIRATD